MLGIEILCDRSQGLLRLSQKAYNDKILERFRMDKYFAKIVPIHTGDKFSEMQCSMNELERKEMKSILYASIIWNSMYAQIYTRLEISFVVGMLGQYLSNPRMNHWKIAKKILGYLQGTNDYMHTYKRSYHLEVIDYSDSNYVRCENSRCSTFGYMFLLGGGTILWKNGQESVIATSTMEVEFVACFEATVQAL